MIEKAGNLFKQVGSSRTTPRQEGGEGLKEGCFKRGRARAYVSAERRCQDRGGVPRRAGVTEGGEGKVCTEPLEGLASEPRLMPGWRRWGGGASAGAKGQETPIPQ